jgi:CheY-like chemotaxis protein
MAKLMLVEDDNNLREIYEARLQAEGYQIIPAKDGEEALVLAKSEKPDLIIADVMMPKISGFEMLDILRNTEGLKDVKVIMLTALGQNDDQQRATRLGADRYLVKSQVTLEDIVKVSHEILGDQAAPPTPAPEPEPTPPVSTPAPEPAPAAPAPDLTPTPIAAPPPAAVTPSAPVASQIPVTEPPASPGPSPDPAPADPLPADPAPAAPPTPAPEPEPTPSVSTPAPEPAPSSLLDNQSTQDTQSVVQEEADVESKVEDFVAGATEEPTTPSGEPGPTTTDTKEDPAPAAPPTPAPEPAPVEPPTDTSTTTSDDDKLMADAAEALVKSTEPDTVAPATPSAQVTVNVTPPGEPTPPADDPKPPADGRSKKIIQPLDLQPKTDINTLLALEEAEEAKSQTPPQPAAVVAVDDPKAPPAPVPPNPVIEPPATSDDSSAADEPALPVSTVQPNDPANPDSIAL